ncbi:MAG: AraC family transcriptional regulator [Parvibaculum sp.]|uniref:helix-turn-helix domain-containing protein n=1 Tax=Parvibaculum sp. TaxID=2024848 RepID=UPI0025D8BA00|nr:AraC family transcriptional regulator [Parvibaculum sp.]MCE9648187.1 AraC family transcriptional regulator [Parvibaculum sp.]
MTQIPSDACGTLYLWPDSFLYVGRDVAPGMHRHNAVECAIALDGPLRVRTEDGIDTQVDRAVLVDANVKHCISSPGRDVAFLYLEKTSCPYWSVPECATEWSAPGICSLQAPIGAALRAKIARAWPGALDDAEASAAKAEILSLLAPAGADRPPLDPRVGAVIAYIASHTDVSLSGDRLAALAGLSPSRFQHLFKQIVGMPVRRYILWFRIRRVIEAMHDGASLTRAAHEAGFSDSAHFTRTFKAMIGLPPSDLFGRKPRVNIALCNLPEQARRSFPRK